MAILTTSGRVGIAASVKQQEMYLAWGTGDESWGATPPTDGMITATGLLLALESVAPIYRQAMTREIENLAAHHKMRF